MQLFAAARTSMSLSWLLAATLLWCAGCGAGVTVVPVSGTVSLDGQPLAGASVTTQPIGGDSANPGSGSFGHTDDQGRFELELVKPAVPGAVIGEHRVMISPASDVSTSNQPQRSADGNAEFWTDDPNAHLQEAKKRWPTSFTDGTLRLQVPPEGTTTAHFDLKR